MSFMEARRQLEKAMLALEAQRAALGDTAVDAALSGLRRKLAELDQMPPPSPTPPPATDERKLVTVMFADISGFTAMSEKMDPEAVRNTMNACFECLVPVLGRYGGTVDKFIGDEIMALFGAPVAHENDPERAVRAALEMKAALNSFNAKRGTDLGIHFGINTGLVLAGHVGSQDRKEYSVMGDAVNLAARLEDASARGQIFVGPDTYRLTAPLFEFRELEPLTLKGKAEPVAVYQVLRAKARPGRRRGLTGHGLHSPIVGRAREVAAFHARLARLQQGMGGIVGIVGEAGLGKSRLLSEAKSIDETRHPHFVWLEGRALSFGGNIAYWPFREILRQYAGVADEDSEAEAWDKLERKVAWLFPERVSDSHTPALAEVIPYLGILLAPTVPEKYRSRVAYLDGDGLGKQIFFASRRFWERFAQSQPVVLVFEDLHWMDESSFRLLEHLLPLVRQAPLLFVGLSRPAPQFFAARLREKVLAEYADEYEDLRLRPLSPSDSAQLAHNLLAIENLAPHLRERLVRKADGNPFFLEEIIRMLIETGMVARDARTGKWRAATQIETLAIPDTIQGVVMARVDRLDERVKQVLRMAAVIGRNFLYRVLRTVDEADHELDRRLAELKALELIREKSATPELEYFFRHALAQEATYESILLQKRRELHARVGAVLEDLFSDRLEEFNGLLAYHYAKAETWDKAHAYLMKAADRAGQMAADAEALEHYRQALEAYSRAFGDSWDPLQRARVERKMGEALFRRGEHVRARDYLMHGLALLGYSLPTSRPGVYLKILRAGLLQALHRLLPGVSSLKSGTPSPTLEEWERLAIPLGWIVFVTDPELFLVLILDALNRCEKYGFDRTVAIAFSSLGFGFDLMSLFWLAERYHRQGVALAERFRHPGAVGFAYTSLAYHHASLGRMDSGAECFRNGARAFREAGDMRGWGSAAAWTTRLMNFAGEFLRGLEQAREVVRLGTGVGDRHIEGWGFVVQGWAELRLGDLENGCTRLRQGIDILDMVPDYPNAVEARGLLGKGLLRQGRIEEALTVLEESQRLCVRHRVNGYYAATACNGHAEACLAAAEQSGPAERGDWLRKARHACRTALKRGKSFQPGLPEAMRLRGRYAWSRGRKAKAGRWWKRSLREARAACLRYDEGLVLMEMGCRLEDRACLEQAVDIFAAIGAEYDLYLAREALAKAKG